MSDDAELELFRKGVNCAALLEQLGGGWKLDQQESTRRALKYRGGPGQIIIVNHEGRGWWDATGTAKGGVFSLVQHLRPGLNLGEVRKVLRGFVGLSPAYPSASLVRAKRDTADPPAERWAARPRLTSGDKTWHYLRQLRSIPSIVLHQAAAQDVVRHGVYDSAWFAHRRAGLVTHVEIRGPTYKGSLSGGSKSLFRFGRASAGMLRLAVLEAPIDALSLAALEASRVDTLYVATGGGIGPGTWAALREELAHLAQAGGTLAIGTDANAAGDRYAQQLEELAAEQQVAWERLRPPDGQDWNDVLRQEGRGGR